MNDLSRELHRKSTSISLLIPGHNGNISDFYIEIFERNSKRVRNSKSYIIDLLRILPYFIEKLLSISYGKQNHTTIKSYIIDLLRILAYTHIIKRLVVFLQRFWLIRPKSTCLTFPDSLGYIADLSELITEIPGNGKKKSDHGLSSFHLYLLKQRSYEHFKISHTNHTNYLISKDDMTNKNPYHTSGPHPGYYPGLLDENG